MIEIISDNYKIDIDHFNNVIKIISSQLGLNGDATIKIGDEKESRALNNKFRNKDYPTDVLTFIANEELPDGYYLGDIFICDKILIDQAAEAKISEKLELTILIIHGLLHLKGYDHETDSGEMLRLQEELLIKLR